MKNILILSIIVLTACKGQVENNQKDLKAQALETLTTAIDSLYNSEFAENKPGAAVLIAYDGEMLIGKGYGLRDLENKESITSSTNLRIGSVAKQFTALAVLKLVDEGKLSLSDSVYSILPIETFNDGTTIEQLINHTSGKEDAEDAFLDDPDVWDEAKIATNQNYLAWYSKEDRTVDEPGKTFYYNNGAYALLAIIVEKVSGQAFANFVKENIFDVANMPNTNYFDPVHPTEIPERAFCYEQEDNGNWEKVDGHFISGVLGAGGIYTSLNDFFNYDLALRQNKIVSKASHELVFKPSSTEVVDGKQYDYAMGWGINTETGVASHSGGFFGASSMVIMDLKRNLTIVIFQNYYPGLENGLVKKTKTLADDYIKTIANNGYK